MSTKMSPAARMATILGQLKSAPDNLRSSDQLRDSVPDYQGDSGRRIYRHDLQALATRGLVTTNLSSARTPNRTGVKLRFIGKPSDWELTDAEHAALRTARRHRAQPAPTTDGRRCDRGTRLDVAMDALRILEEQGEWLTGAQIAAELGLTPRDVVAAMKELDMPDDVNPSVFDGIVVLAMFDDNDSELPPAEVRIRARRSNRRARPLRNYGLDVLGRFAYTAGETADRLRLIDAELDAPQTDTDVESLGGAQKKLLKWAEHLRASS